MLKYIAAMALFLVTPAIAQQPDVATLQKATSVLAGQRNQAMDAAANAEIRAAALAEDNAKLKAELEELKKKLAAEPVKP